MKPRTKPATRVAKLIPSSLTIRAGVIALALVLIASLGAPLTPLPAGAQAQKRGGIELRDDSPASPLDQRSVTVSTSVGQTRKKGKGELRVEPPLWLFDHSTGTGRRAADIGVTTDANKAATGIEAPNRAEGEKYVGKLSTSRPAGYSPAQIRRAYGFDQLEADGRGQVIAIVIAFDYPNAAADLKTFIKTFKLKNMFGLPGRAPCTVAARSRMDQMFIETPREDS